MDRVGGEDADADDEAKPGEAPGVDEEEEEGGGEDQKEQDEQRRQDGNKVMRKEKTNGGLIGTNVSCIQSRHSPRRRPPPHLTSKETPFSAAPGPSDAVTTTEIRKEQRANNNNGGAAENSDDDQELEILKIVEQRARVARNSLSLDNKAKEEDKQTENEGCHSKNLNYNKQKQENRVARISPYLDEAEEEEGTKQAKGEGCSSSSKGDNNNNNNNNKMSNPKLQLKEEQLVALSSDDEEGYPLGMEQPPCLLRATGTNTGTGGRAAWPGAFAESRTSAGTNVSISRSATIFTPSAEFTIVEGAETGGDGSEAATAAASTTQVLEENNNNNEPKEDEDVSGSLVKANLVTPTGELPVATQFHHHAAAAAASANQHEQADKGKRRRTVCILLTTLVLAVVTTGIVLIAVLLSGDTTATATTPTNQSKTTLQQQQQQPQNEEERILNLLPEISIPLIIKGNTNEETKDSSSPQYKAFEWIMGDPFLQEYSNHRIQTRYILATLFFATGGKNWINNTNWLSYEHHECQWHISRPTVYKLNPTFLETITRAGQKLVYIDELLNITNAPCGDNGIIFQHLILVENNLHGTLPEEFFYLSQLQSFVFHHNPNLAGTIDSTLATTKGMAQNLKLISLRSPKISGYLPTQIGLMTNLIQITLHDTNIQTTIPTELFLLSNSLRGIRMGRSTRVSGTIPTEIGNMSLLRSISFQQRVEDDDSTATGLQGVIPSEMGRLTALESLALYDNGKIHMAERFPHNLD